MSPGNTTGTHAPNDLALPFRIAAKYVMPHLGISHKLDVGAKRLVDGVTDPTLSSGVFYASAANKMKGPVVDQADIFPDLANPRFRTTPTRPSTASSPQRQSRNTRPTGSRDAMKLSPPNCSPRCSPQARMRGIASGSVRPALEH